MDDSAMPDVEEAAAANAPAVERVLIMDDIQKAIADNTESENEKIALRNVAQSLIKICRDVAIKVDGEFFFAMTEVQMEVWGKLLERHVARDDRKIEILESYRPTLEQYRDTLDGQRQKIENQSQTIASQSQTIENQRQTIETQRETIESLRATIESRGEVDPAGGVDNSGRDSPVTVVNVGDNADEIIDVDAADADELLFDELPFAELSTPDKGSPSAVRRRRTRTPEGWPRTEPPSKRRSLSEPVSPGDEMVEDKNPLPVSLTRESNFKPTDFDTFVQWLGTLFETGPGFPIAYPINAARGIPTAEDVKEEFLGKLATWSMHDRRGAFRRSPFNAINQRVENGSCVMSLVNSNSPTTVPVEHPDKSKPGHTRSCLSCNNNRPCLYLKKTPDEVYHSRGARWEICVREITMMPAPTAGAASRSSGRRSAKK